MARAVYAAQEKLPAVRDEIERCIGRHALTVVIEEDQQTLATVKVEGLVAFIATLLKGERVISQGRGIAVLSQTNRFIGRTIGCALNNAVSDAAIRATRVLDQLRDKSEVEIAEATRDSRSGPATERQREYIRQLVRVNGDEAEREDWESRLGELTKAEASSAIETLKR